MRVRRPAGEPVHRARDVPPGVDRADGAPGSRRGALECLEELGWIRPEALLPVGGPRLLQNFDWDADDLGDACQDAAERVKHLARRIADERKILRSQSRAVEANEALEQAATVASLALPSTNATAKILRDEAAIQRQLAQAMPGHPVPPPISVTVSQ